MPLQVSDADPLRLCACCIGQLANDDTSGCRDYWDHPDHALQCVTGELVPGDWIEPTVSGMCDGCEYWTELVHTAVQLVPSA